jgi:hypothetical protein
MKNCIILNEIEVKPLKKQTVAAIQLTRIKTLQIIVHRDANWKVA